MTTATPPVQTAAPPAAARHRWWARCTRHVGAYGMTAVLGLGALSSAARGCGGDDPPTQRERVVQITNERRADHDLPRLRAHTKLNRAAQLHSKDQARRDRMSHTGSDGSDVGQRVTRQGYRWSWVGENVAAGYRNAGDVMRGWMNSAGHRRNILNRNFTEIGVGLARSNDGTRYWTMVLARPR